MLNICVFFINIVRYETNSSTKARKNGFVVSTIAVIATGTILIGMVSLVRAKLQALTVPKSIMTAFLHRLLF